MKTDNYGFIKVAAAIPNVKVADCQFNASHIEDLINEADSNGVQIVCFPELSVTGYTCGDLFNSTLLISQAEEALSDILSSTANLNIISIVGLPVQVMGKLFNCAAILYKGTLAALCPKSYLPNHNEFYEKRWFSPADDVPCAHTALCGQTVPFGNGIIICCGQFSFSTEICEDLWVTIPPSCEAAMAGAQIVFNLSASNELIGKDAYLRQLVSQQSARCIAGYVYASAGFGESSTDLVYAGKGFIAENGTIIGHSERFSLKEQLIINDIDVNRIAAERRKTSTFGCGRVCDRFRYVTLDYEMPRFNELHRYIDPYPFIPKEDDMRSVCGEIFNIQAGALATRLHHTGVKSMVVGISGGLDSTLALLVCVKTCALLGLPKSAVTGITMPGYGTTDRTYNNAVEMIKRLGCTFREISIREACDQHFRDICHNPDVHDVTYENTQARERTQILMDVANQTGGMVIGTGDLSELALGWATYNGDHMSMYGVNASIPKTLVRYMVRYVAENEVDSSVREILLDVIDTPVSPELLPADADGNISQKTEDLVGPYDLHDFFLFYTLRYGFAPSKIKYMAEIAFKDIFDKETIDKWLKTFIRRFFSQQFKRNCMPDAPKVGSVCLSPRGDWRMPSDASSRAWMEDTEMA